MSLEKLTITYEALPRDDVFRGRLVALFNPSQLSLSNGVEVRQDQAAGDVIIAQKRQVSFASIRPATLTLDLFFDTYEGDPRARTRLIGAARTAISPFALAAGASLSASSVLPYTDAMAALTRNARDLHRPPICKLTWGNWQVFEGILSQLSREFSLFLEDGTPVRAACACTFTEYVRLASTPSTEQFSPDVAKRYTVRPGDTLVNIAAAFYDDASAWRLVAQANGIENPRKLPPGLVLTIPKLTSEEE